MNNSPDFCPTCQGKVTWAIQWGFNRDHDMHIVKCMRCDTQGEGATLPEAEANFRRNLRQLELKANKPF